MTEATDILPHDEAAEPAYAAAAVICRRHARPFYLASYFVPKHKRQAAYAAYAFCWMIGDAMKVTQPSIATGTGLREHPAVVSPSHLIVPPTDESAVRNESELETRLAMFRDRLTEIYDGKLELPAVASRSEAQHALEAFSRASREFNIPKQYFLDLAEGYRADATVTRYATWSRLEKHCYQTAGVVAEIIGSVLGLMHSDANRHSAQLGNAVRLTTILQNIKADRDRGRIYLPLEDLARFRYSEADLSAGTANDAFRELMAFEIARVRGLFEQSADGICWLADEGTRLSVAGVLTNQLGLLRAIERQQYDVFKGKAVQLPSEQMRRIPAAWRLARRKADEPLPKLD